MQRLCLLWSLETGLFLFIGRSVGILRIHGDREVQDRTLQADDGQWQMFHSCRHEDDRALGQTVQFPTDTDFDHAAQIVWIIRIGADESDQLIKIMAVFIMLIKSIQKLIQ